MVATHSWLIKVFSLLEFDFLFLKCDLRTQLDFRIEIKACPSVEMIEKENSIKLVMMGARRDDTGIYTLKADNDHGQDQADVEVVVMVEPSKPRGPMKMNDITADGIYTKRSFSYLFLHINSFVLPFSFNFTLQSVKQRLIYLWKLIEMK